MFGWLRRLLAALWRWFDRGALERRTVRYGTGALDQTREVVEPTDAPRGPEQRRRAVRDQRLLPKRDKLNPWAKPPSLFAPATAARLFAPTFRTGNRDLRTLATDPAQLARFGLPAWTTEAEVAAALGISLGALRHLTLHRHRERAPHYVTFAVPKASGGERLICAPKRRLKEVQRRLVRAFVDLLPVHDAAHGFRQGRSVRTAAEPHVGRQVVLRVDLEDFFGTVTFPRVRGLLVAYGYGYEVATVLAVLVTEAPRQPVDIEGTVYHVPVGPRHCVQGAPTSPGVCNALAYRLDRRLAGLAAQRGFAYTRYADDLTFSSDEPRRVGALLGTVRDIVTDEGFRVNEAKTRVARAGRAQRVCGVTVNETLGLSRQARRRLRAMIHQARLQPPDEARAAVIDGWLAYLSMLNPEQAAPLRAQWQAPRPGGPA